MSISPHLITKIEQIINNNIQVMGLLAEIADDIDDPGLRAIIISLIGDENGNIRFFTLLLSLIGGDKPQNPVVRQCSEENKALQTQPRGITPLSSVDNPAVDAPTPKQNPLLGSEIEEESPPINIVDDPKMNLEVSVEKRLKKLIWTFGN